ncbi:hypothetical protein [Bacteroides thetaiotaomicron]|jgi:hypothetical protein|uniref:hypothetical protein n=1 Tax=Bacteroides thetaiotaomicron TaxID=818 RepID=UPI001927D7B7|nr:hypothetical protein [Bacteroides thetaiotaomicron]MBL3927854.1 hypothetical protein [Bacteroides thetaiotaomicron]MBL3952187.1 hypothetical protein [Bacteroides thetaiotaomicron]DAU63577.1 MAG TPA: hypothetical protein [Caudoviricetes sp.]DAX07088.1 MAG TPA: hypothetical protein [Bacteriophage sp.]
MNSYQLISKLRKVRDDTYLTTAAQALYHELVAICNDMKWKDVFFVRSNILCGNLDMSDNTLRKSRECLSNAGLIHFRSSKDKRIGCYYSFMKSISDDLLSSATSSATSSANIEDESANDSEKEIVNSSAISSATSSAKNEDDKNTSSATSSANIEDETQFPPIIDNINIKQEESLAHTHESTPPEKPKRSRKKEGDSKPLVYPFDSIAFMSAWTELVKTPKWKGKLNYALQISLNKLGKFEEEFAIRQIERAIESNWTGVVFSGTERDYQEWLKQKKYGNNQKPCTSKQEANDHALQQYITERQRREQGLVDEVERPF